MIGQSGSGISYSSSIFYSVDRFFLLWALDREFSKGANKIGFQFITEHTICNILLEVEMVIRLLGYYLSASGIGDFNLLPSLIL